MTRQNTNIMPYWKLINQIIRECDVVLEVVDARFIEKSHNKEIEKLIKEKARPSILVVNKTDLVSKRDLEMSIDKLKESGKKNVAYITQKRKSTIKNLLAKIEKVFEEHGKHEKPIFNKFTPKQSRGHREAKADIIVGVVGYPNVGKSSLINALSFKKKAKVTPVAGTTHGTQWISAGERIKFIDTPGVIPLKYMSQTDLGLIGARGIDKIKDKEIVAGKILEMFLERNKHALEKYYDIKIQGDTNAYEFIEQLGTVRGHLKKGGVVDENRTSDMIIRDWQQGRLKL
jgi:ribosome biogenesis GTPase A